MRFQDVLGGMGLLIFVYLLVSNASGTGSVINSIGGFFTKETVVLQGRSNSAIGSSIGSVGGY